MTDATTPWDDLPEYEQNRIAALPFDEMIAALCEHAPKASAGDILALLGNDHTKREIREARDRWKASRQGKGEPVFTPAVPTREAVIQQLNLAVETKDAQATERWARSLVALSRVGNVDVEADSTEEWDRLSDLEAGVLVALTRKLNGEPLTRADGEWLAHLRS